VDERMKAMAYGAKKRAPAQWADLDDLVAEEFCAFDHQPPRATVPQSPPERHDGANPGRAPIAASHSPPLHSPPPNSPPPHSSEVPPAMWEAAFNDDETRLLVLCRILGTADDPCRLIQRLTASLSPSAPNGKAAGAAAPPQAGDAHDMG
jgi:hypothetical protein